jgi:hypothetical protein
MGAHPYWYVVPYETDVAAALDKLRKREFQAGRYNPVTPFPAFPVDPNSAGPGSQHASIEDAMNDSDADGTRSILDIFQVAQAPSDGSQPSFCSAFPLADSVLVRLFGSARPTREMVERSDNWGSIERGSAIYVVLFQNDQPHELFFAGYSFD